MTRTKIVIAALTVSAVTGAALLGGAFVDSAVSVGASSGQRTPAEARANQELLGNLLRGLGDGSSSRYVRRLERRVAAGRADMDALTLLGFAYQQRARETADPSFYGRSARALRRARASGGDPSLVATGLASLAVSRHRFREALPHARRALRVDPDSATAYGALGDALANLGRYREAFAAFDRMAELSPSVASYARVAHARELLGRRGAAAEDLRLALELDTSIPEHAAATLVQLGNIRFAGGELERARRAYARALARVPGYVRAEAGLARVEAARGQYASAARRLRRVVETLPLPEYAIWLGDVLAASGRSGEARDAYALVAAIERLLTASGVRTELQTALFDLDHRRRPAEALARARLAYRAAPSVQAADVLAWALLRNGRCTEARTFSERALRLGTEDALSFFHRGMIERCLGRPRTARAWFARALQANPHFSLLWAPVARRYAS